VGEALRAVLGQRQRVDAGDLGDDRVFDVVLFDQLAGVGAGRDTHPVVVAQDRRPGGERAGELAVDVDDRDAGLHGPGGDLGQLGAVGRQDDDGVDFLVDERLDLADLQVGVVRAFGHPEFDVFELFGLGDGRVVDRGQPAVVGLGSGEADDDLLARLVVATGGGFGVAAVVTAALFLWFVAGAA